MSNENEQSYAAKAIAQAVRAAKRLKIPAPDAIRWAGPLHCRTWLNWEEVKPFFFGRAPLPAVQLHFDRQKDGSIQLKSGERLLFWGQLV